MILDFKDQSTEDVYNGIRSKQALKRLPVHLWNVAYRKFYALDNAISLNDLKSPPSNRLEALKGDREEGIVSGSMINTGYVLSGHRQDRLPLKS